MKRFLFNCLGVTTYCAAICAAAICSASGSTPVFTKNMGQWPDSILYRTDEGGATLWFTATGIIYQFTRSIERSNASADLSAFGPSPIEFEHHEDSTESMLIQVSFVDASPKAEIIPEGLTEYKCNYFLGNDPSKWHTDVPNFESITLHQPYEGIDIDFHRDRSGNLKCRYANITSCNDTFLRVALRGITKLTQSVSNSLAVRADLGISRDTFSVPLSNGVSVFQMLMMLNTRESEVSSNFAAPGSGFSISTYIGGSGDDVIKAVGVDNMGNTYVTGWTSSADFPVVDALDSIYEGGLISCDIFVSKLDLNSSSIIYSTFLGGSTAEESWGITLDSLGSAYVTGRTWSSDFPTARAYCDQWSGVVDGFVAKLTPEGNCLTFATYLGGSDWDECCGIAVNSLGDIFVVGSTVSADFPVFRAYDSTFNIGFDGFVTKLSPGGDSVLYSTYLGGNTNAFGVAVNEDGCAFVTGMTRFVSFPVVNAYDSVCDGEWDAFVTKLAPDGMTLVFSTFVGGNFWDRGYAIALDTGSNIYMCGVTLSNDFPSRNAFVESYQGERDGFIIELEKDGKALLYATYVGGTEEDEANSIALDAGGNVYVCGITYSPDFPVLQAVQGFYGGGGDAFAVAVEPKSGSAIYSTYLGGANRDIAWGIDTDASRSAFIVGETVSSDFPLYHSFQENSDRADAFVVKLAAGGCCIGTTGNVNTRGIVDLSDLSALVSFFTGGAYELPCMEEANVDGTGIVDLSDLSALVSYLTGFGFVLPNCP